LGGISTLTRGRYVVVCSTDEPGILYAVKILLTREVALSIQTVSASPRAFLPSILAQGAPSTASSPTGLRSFRPVSGSPGTASGINKLGTVNDERPEIPVPAATAVASGVSLIAGGMVHQVLERSGAASLQMTNRFRSSSPSPLRSVNS